jgi:hypothetical protein
VTREFGDRFDAATYVNDEFVHVFRADQHAPLPDSGVWVPERLWGRIRCIGLGYELHLTSVFDGSADPVFLTGPQVAQLDNELVFIADLVDDPLLSSWLELLLGLLRVRSQIASRFSVGLEFP